MAQKHTKFKRVSCYRHHPPFAPTVLQLRVTTVDNVLHIFYVCINMHRSVIQMQKLKLRYATCHLTKQGPSSKLSPNPSPLPGAVQGSAGFSYRNVTHAIL